MSKVRIYLKQVDDYAMHDLGPARHTHIDVESPELAALLRDKPYPWFAVGMELVEDTETGGGRS